MTFHFQLPVNQAAL